MEGQGWGQKARGSGSIKDYVGGISRNKGAQASDEDPRTNLVKTSLKDSGMGGKESDQGYCQIEG